MAISLQRDFLNADRTYLKKIDTDVTRQIISPRNSARKSGLICNLSRYDLFIWFGSNPPVNSADWLVLPQGSNCDIPLFFIGDIYGFWAGNDNRNAKVYEFYGS